MPVLKNFSPIFHGTERTSEVNSPLILNNITYISDYTISLIFYNISEDGSEIDSLAVISGEASPTFGLVNANISVFVDGKRNQFLKK